MSLLGIDIGTSGVRVAAYDLTGELLTSRSASSKLLRPAPGLVETDAEAVLAAIESAIAALVQDPALAADPIAALSFSAQGEAVVPVDSDGIALSHAPVSMDRRGEANLALVEDHLGGDLIQKISGQPPHAMFSIYKIAAVGSTWAVDGQVAGFRCLDGFVAARLGARDAIDWSMAARTGAFDVLARTWSAQILQAVRDVTGSAITQEMLPTPVAPGTVIGEISNEAAVRTGLLAGTPIVAGLHDQAASFLGAGGELREAAVFSLGSSDCLTVATRDRPEVEGTGFASYPISDAVWLTLAGTAAGGWALDWFARLVGEDIARVFDEPAATPPALLTLPYFTGSGTLDNDSSARGVIAGLSLDTTQAEVVRAFLEATGYELAKISDAFGNVGVGIPPIHAVGGGAANRAALEIRAEAAGAALIPTLGHASARGAALLAGIGIGSFHGVEALPPAVTGQPAEPTTTNQPWYDTQRAAFRELYQAMRPINQKLSNKKVKP